MNGKPPVIDKASLIIGLLTLAFSLAYFYNESHQFYYSFIAAVITAVIIWSSYIIIRFFYLAMRSDLE